MTKPALRSIPIVACCALLGACAGNTSPATPELRVPARYAAGGPAEPAHDKVELNSTYPVRNTAEQAWWRAFDDERLSRLVERVLAANPNLAAAGLTLRKARLQAGLASNDLWPQPSGSVTANGNHALSGDATTQRSGTTSLSLSWEIDLWGRLRAARDAAQWEARASAADRENTALALAGEACRQYWTLAYLNHAIGTGQARIDQLRRTLQLVQVQFGAGSVSLLDVRDAQQNLQAQLAAQSQLEQQRVQARNAITVLLGGQAWPRADEPTRLDGAATPAPRPGLPAGLLGRRPDLRAAELRLREALANIDATARSYYPALTLTGSAGTSSTSLSNLLANPVAALGAGLALPFLNVPRMRLDNDIARTGYEIAANTFRGTLYSALKDVDDALSARARLAEQREATERSFEAAQDVERMYGVRYRVGAATLRTWLDAQQTLREAELSLAQVRQNQRLNDVTLFLALGGDPG
ncbi:multidrug efflux outer membrane lipoprotein [Bordetella ansorpii]|uniref:Multidrug efflux outer membrane lipoprotein n=1 Tax=Bordetella ansorpii TaxID=288768 RepID=A0A157S5H3_9BORD|nr:efflux transporter outer membrane subunit [Bordetella ansorpii]SAI65654.1 multidrug efflux outer membrane lipoprotein [Bordetella ansorpii]